MGVTTLFSDGESWVASTRLVYTATERDALASVAEQAARLGELLATREATLERAREEARREGIEHGRREGVERAAVDLGESLSAWRDAAAAERRRQREAVVELALGVVRRVVGEFAPAERLAALARVAAEELLEEPRLVLRVHPERRAELAERLRPRDDVAASDGVHPSGRRRATPFDEIVGDETLAVDGALIETSGGHIAIDLETQLDAIGERLSGAPELETLLDAEPRA